MISFWLPAADSFTIRNYLAGRGLPIASHFVVRHFDDLAGETRAAGPAHIFSAMDQLGPAGRHVAAELWDRLAEAAPEWTRLNDPRRVLLRQPFLAAMADAGLNDFRAYPATEFPATVRFPAFIRERDRHNGPLTGLLDSARAVAGALRALRLRGYRAHDLLLIEYLDTSDGSGRFRKYSAYRVGHAIIRTHMMISTGWSVKSENNSPALEVAREERDYRCGDLHEAWIRQVFDLARIDFGRIDYGVAGGRPQAWEINLNPTIGRRPDQVRKPMAPDLAAVVEEGRLVAHARLREAFVALDQPAVATPERTVVLPGQLLRAYRREAALAVRRDKALTIVRQAFHSRILGWPVRAVYRTLFRRG